MAMVYIHANAVKHGIGKDFADYPCSSWHTIISDKPTLLARAELIEWCWKPGNMYKSPLRNG